MAILIIMNQHGHFDREMAECRTHYNDLEHCADKFVRIIRKMITDNLDFNLDQETFIPIIIDLENAPT